MPPASVADPTVVRVTVASATRRLDLLLPAAVPVVELLPELAACLGLLDDETARLGHQLVDPGGRVLRGGAGLASQGVADGALLTISLRAEEVPPRSHDDSAEAMVEAVERRLRPWQPDTGRRAALVAAAALLALAAWALLLAGEGLPGGVLSAGLAALLVVGGVVSDDGRSGSGVVATWLAAPLAGVAGLLLAPGELVTSRLSSPVVAAGAGMLTVGVVAAAGLRSGRVQVLPVVVTGAVLVGCGVATLVLPVAPSVVHVTAMTVVVLAGHLLPWLALGVTGTRADPVVPPGGPDRTGAGIEAARIEADAVAGHDVLLALSACVGVVLVLAAPLAVGRGAAGTVLAVTCCLTVMLRVRQHRAADVLVGLASGMGGLVSVAVSVLLVHPSWRPEAAVALAVSGVLLAGWSLLPTSRSVRAGWVGDVVETVALLSLLPLLVAATGVLGRVWG